MFNIFSKKTTKPLAYPYDPQTEKAVIRASICNGEQVAGFKNLKTGEFHEVSLIRNEEELNAFKQIYGLDKIEKIY